MPLDSPRWDPQIRLALDQLLGTTVPASAPLATLDWDNTCIDGDVSEALLGWLGQREGRDLLAEYGSLYASHGYHRAYAFCAEVGGGRSPADLEALAEQALNWALASGSVTLRPAMAELVDALHSRGWEVWVVSASQETVVRVAAARMGIPPERVIGVELQRDPRGHLLRAVVEPMPMFEGKASAIRQRIGRVPELAAGDSPNDLPMLRLARHALVVDRGHTEVQDEARRRGWWVQRGWHSASLEHR